MNDNGKNIEEPIEELYQETSNIAAYHELDEWSKKMAVTPVRTKEGNREGWFRPENCGRYF